MRTTCTATTRSGAPCRAWAVTGGTTCRQHAARAQDGAEGARNDAVSPWARHGADSPGPSPDHPAAVADGPAPAAVLSAAADEAARLISDAEREAERIVADARHRAAALLAGIRTSLDEALAARDVRILAAVREGHERLLTLVGAAIGSAGAGTVPNGHGSSDVGRKEPVEALEQDQHAGQDGRDGDPKR